MGEILFTATMLLTPYTIRRWQHGRSHHLRPRRHRVPIRQIPNLRLGALGRQPRQDRRPRRAHHHLQRRSGRRRHHFDLGRETPGGQGGLRGACCLVGLFQVEGRTPTVGQYLRWYPCRELDQVVYHL